MLDSALNTQLSINSIVTLGNMPVPQLSDRPHQDGTFQSARALPRTPTFSHSHNSLVSTPEQSEYQGPSVETGPTFMLIDAAEGEEFMRWKREQAVELQHDTEAGRIQEEENREMVGKRKRSYTREEKLRVIKAIKGSCTETNSDGLQTVNRPLSYHAASKQFQIDRKRIREWVKSEKKIADSGKGTRQIGGGRGPEWPRLEERLYELFAERRREGFPIDRKWFNRYGKRIFEEEYPEQVERTASGIKYRCSFSDSWFKRFKQRWSISYRVSTTKAQKQPSELEKDILEFLRFVRRNTIPRQGEPSRDIGRYYLDGISNMDQLPLPFETFHTRTYDKKGTKSVRLKVARKNYTMRQASLMISISADAVPRCMPLLIFAGTGKDTKKLQAETAQYDKRVVVQWTSSGWSNEKVTLQWIRSQYQLAVPYEHQGAPRMIALDVYAPQRTAAVLTEFSKLNTVTSFIPNGCTSYVQPLDVVVNKPLKDLIRELIDQEVEKDLEHWYHPEQRKGMAVGERRILLTKCVGEAWETFHREKSDLIKHAFQKVGLALPPDGSANNLISISDLPDITQKFGSDWMHGGLNCNLMKGRKTGSGVLAEDNWAETIRLLGVKGWLVKKTGSRDRDKDNEDSDTDGKDSNIGEMGSFVAANEE